MAFFRRASGLPATLMNHTGTIIRFKPSQMPSLPATRTACLIVLPHGALVDGRFNPNPKNPNITGAALRQWIASTVPFKASIEVHLVETAAGHLAVVPLVPPRTDPDLATEMVALAELPAERRREGFERWERSPSLRRKVLATWPHACQVIGCTTLLDLPADLLIAALEVHHVAHISGGGTDGLLNLCLLCANHHRLIHLGRPPAVVSSSSADDVLIRVGSADLAIRRDLGPLLRP